MALVSGSGASRWLAAALCLGTMLPAQAGGAGLEYAVKANYLYKFAPFVTWPGQVFANDRAAFQICVAGTDPFGSALDAAVRGQRVGSHPVAVRRIARADMAAGCHILFVGGSKAQPTAEMLRAAARLPVLTVADDQQGAGGSAIRFVVRGGRVRFVINRGAAGGAGLAISSKLLELALAVEN